MPAPACPPDDALAALGTGRLPADTADTVRAHLSTCHGCAAKFTALSGGTAVGGWPSGVAPAPPPAVPLPAGEVPPELAALPRYEDVRELGRGGMGVVYLARNAMMDRPEVLKVVSRQLLAVPGVKERFLREVRAAARLQHPNVVAAYSVEEAGESLVFSMEYVPGDDLQKVVKAAGPLPAAQACFYTAQVAAALQHAADKGMVHRDIKPANLMLARDGKRAVVKVLDFGLAKVVSERAADTGLTGAGQMMGTPDYIAPEQAKDAARADTRADLYSLGCTLYFLLAGRPPFHGTSLFDVLQKHAHDTPDPIPGVPPALTAVVNKLMAKRPDDRYPTPAAAAAALKPFYAGKPTTAPVVPAAATPVARTPALPLPLPAADASPWADVTGGAKSTTVRPTPAEVEDDEDGRPRRKASKEEPEPQAAGRPKWLWPAVAGGGAVALLLLCGLGMLLFGVVFKTKEGTVEITDLPADADVFVDGEKATVTWDKGRQKAEVQVKAGTPHKVEVKRNGTTVTGDTVEIADGGRKVMTARVKVKEPDTTGKGDLSAKSPQPKPALSRFVVQSGRWRVDKGELVQDGNARSAVIVFGDADWTDYDYTVTMKSTGGSVQAMYRYLGPLRFTTAFVRDRKLPNGDSQLEVESHDPSDRKGTPPDHPDGFRDDVHDRGVPRCDVTGWHTFKVSVRGQKATLSVNGGLGVAYNPVRHANGMIGLRTYDGGGRFKDIRVTTPEGKVLWDGMPDLPAEGKRIDLPAGGVLVGNQTFVKGAYSPGSVPYELHIESSDGDKFTGHIFANGTGRNRSEVEGGWDGETFRWREGPGGGGGPATEGVGTFDGATVRATMVGRHEGRWINDSVLELVLADGPVRTERGKRYEPPATATKTDFTPLFNGTDLSGWKTHKSQPGDWRVAGGMMIGSGPRANGPISHLYTERGDYTDFHLRAECRVNDGGNSGVLGRSSFGPAYPAAKPRFADGYEAQINSTHTDPAKTGSLYIAGDGAVVSVKESPVKAGEWFTLELVVTGDRVLVKVDGKATATYQDPKGRFAKGHIVLQQHDAGTVCEFRKVEIKELNIPPDAAKPADPPPAPTPPADPLAEGATVIGGYKFVSGTSKGNVGEWALTVKERKGKEFAGTFVTRGTVPETALREREVTGEVVGDRVTFTTATGIKATAAGRVTADGLELAYTADTGEAELKGKAAK